MKNMRVKHKINREYDFLIESYKDNYDHVMELTNNNRPENQNQHYFDWRYLGEQSNIPPFIFFVKSKEHKKIGMSALIFRSYYIENEKYFFGVIGDVSLNEEFRGIGIAKELFKLKTRFLREKLFPCALCIGTDKVVRILSDVGWQTCERLVSYLFPINYTEKLHYYLKIKLLSNIIGFLLTNYNKIKLKNVNMEGYTCCEVKEFDHQFDSFWFSLNKKGLIIKDRSISALNWRYASHPNMFFRTVKIFKDNNFVGYIIYRNSNKKIIIYDFIFQNELYVKSAFALFIKKIWEEEFPIAIWIRMINQNHPYLGILRKIGFIYRGEDRVLQLFCPDKELKIDKYKWIITPGDKDI